MEARTSNTAANLPFLRTDRTTIPSAPHVPNPKSPGFYPNYYDRVGMKMLSLHPHIRNEGD